MPRIKIKPLSVNKCWQGRRFKTKDYLAYEQELIYKLPKLKIPPIPLQLFVKAGVSKSSDIDNLLKPFIDILCKKYKFNDHDIYSIEIIKEYAPKGNEYIEFNFK